MVTRESRAELEVFRSVKILDDTFLSKARAIARAAFGERGNARATLRPPLVEEMVAVAAGEPVAKIYDASNLKMPLLWRVAVGDDKAGGKFFKAREALQNGIREKVAASKNAPRPYRLFPLTQQLAEASERSEIGPDASFTLACSGITAYQHRLAHPGTYIFCLTPDISSPAFTTLMTEQRVAEQALYDASGFVYNKQNPQPQLVVPFMRVDEAHTEEQRRDFAEQLLTPNIFPVKIELSHIDFGNRN